MVQELQRRGEKFHLVFEITPMGQVTSSGEVEGYWRRIPGRKRWGKEDRVVQLPDFHLKGQTKYEHRLVFEFLPLNLPAFPSLASQSKTSSRCRTGK